MTRRIHAYSNDGHFAGVFQQLRRFDINNGKLERGSELFRFMIGYLAADISITLYTQHAHPGDTKDRQQLSYK